MSEETLAPADDTSLGVAILDEPAPLGTAIDDQPGLRCDKCGEPTKLDGVTICRSCGWYASLGTYLEVDPNYEFEQSPSVQEASPQPSHIKVWLDLMPWWSWVLLGSVLAIVVESVVVRLATAPEIGGVRTTWSLAQLAIGTSMLLGAHIFSFLVLAAEDANFGLLDVVMRPFKIWIRAFKRLPTRLWVTDTAAIGLTSIVMSLLVIGAIPYDRMWDWGFTPPPKQDLMGAVMDRAKQAKGGGADNLEDAIGDFAGTADSVADAPVASAKAETNRKKADCVILGYRVDKEGRLTQLLLGTSHLGKLVYAGTVTPKMSDEECAELVKVLAASRSHQAFIRLEAEANWVKPRIACRVTYVDVEPSGRLLDIKWDTLVGAMRL